MGTIQEPKRLGLLSSGRVLLLDESVDVDVGEINELVRKLVASNYVDLMCYGMGEECRHVACRQDDGKSKAPKRDILEMLLCVIDKLVGGNGLPLDLKNGTCILYDDTHLIPRHATRGTTTHLLNDYIYIEVRRYGRRKSWAYLRVSMHRQMCWLRWGNASTPESIVCHDPQCARRACVALGCLRWDDNATIARDRVRRDTLRRARQGRAPESVARASECLVHYPC